MGIEFFFLNDSLSSNLSIYLFGFFFLSLLLQLFENTTAIIHSKKVISSEFKPGVKSIPALGSSNENLMYIMKRITDTVKTRDY